MIYYICHSDRALWAAFIRTVRPLPERALARREAISAPPPGPAPEARPPRRPISSGMPPLPSRAKPIRVDSPVLAIDHRTLVHLSRGRMKVDARLDMHGMILEHAQAALTRFIRASVGHRRCLLIITGKGSGVLRRAVPEWLNATALRPVVLGLHHADRRNGGEGAFYVLLRRPRPPEAE